MYKHWIEKTDSEGNKILINPNVVYRYEHKFDTSFLTKQKHAA
jgi:hypothetical protein